MKKSKRFIVLAVIAGMLLSLAGSAWAAYTKSAINSVKNQSTSMSGLFDDATTGEAYSATSDFVITNSSAAVNTSSTTKWGVGSTSVSAIAKAAATYALGNGLTASVSSTAFSAGDKTGTVTVTISGTPTSAGTSSFNLVESGGKKATLQITVVKAPFVSPKAKPVFETTLDLGKMEIKASKEVELKVKEDATGIAKFDLGEGAKDWATVSGTTLTLVPTETGTFEIPVTAEWDDSVLEDGEEFLQAATGTTTAKFKIKVTGITPSITCSLGKDATDLSSAFEEGGVDDEGKVVAGTALGDAGLSFTATGSKGKKFDITVSGLPTGMKATKGSVTTNTDDDTQSDLTATIEGSPTKAGEYTIKVKGTNDDGTGDEVSYTLKVSSNPDLKSLKPSDVTWGQAYSYTLTAKGLAAGEAVEEWAIGTPPSGKTGYLTEAQLTDAGLAIEGNKLTGKWDKMDATDGGVALGSAKDKTYKVMIKAKLGKAEPEQEVSLKFKAAKPAIEVSEEDTVEFVYNGAEEKEITVTATGPGKVKLSATGTPKWMKVESETDDTTGKPKLTITGTPSELASNASFTVTAENAAGKTTSTIKYSVTGELAWDTDETTGGVDPTAEGTLPNGAYLKGEDITAESAVLTVEALPGNVKAALGTIKLSAKPGPIQWKATGLPAGITLKADTKDSTVAYLSGKPTAITTKLDDDGESKYTITATNTVTKDVLTCGGSIVVYDVPEITTKTLPALSTGKAYTAKLAAKNADPDLNATWTVGLGETEEEAKADDTGKMEIGSGTLEFDKDTLTLTGDSDIDRVKDVYVYIKIVNPAATDGVEKVLPLTVKGVAAKVDNVTFGDLAEEGSIEFTSTGTQPITMTAYIDKTAAKSMFGVTDGTSIDLTNADNVAKLTFTQDTGSVGGKMKSAGKAPVNVKEEEGTDHNGTGTLAPAEGLTAVYKNVPVTIAVINAGMTKEATKVFKINYTPSNYEKPSLTVDGEALEDDPELIQGKAGEEVASYVITVAGTDPLDIKVSGAAKDTAEEGVKAAVDGKTITISGKYPEGKESKTTITVTATNTSTKDKVSHKFQFVGALAPEITTKGNSLIKEVEIGKSVNISLAAKGTKTLAWEVSDALPTEMPEVFAEETEAEAGTLPAGLALDPDKGKITGTPTAPTVDGEGAYAPAFVPIKVSNAAGSATTVVKIGVKGKKATLKTKTVTIQKGEDLDLDDAKLEVSGVTVGDEGVDVKFSPAETIVNKVSDEGEAETKKLTDLGLTLGDDGKWTGSDLIATKGTNVKVAVENIGTTTTGSVKIVIKDIAPEIECDDNDGDRIELTATLDDKVEKEYELSIKDGCVTGDTAVGWKISKKPSKIQATITPSAKTADDIAGKTATLKITVPKGFKNNQKKGEKHVTEGEDGKNVTTYDYTDEYLYTDLTVTLTNNSTKATGTMDFKFKVKPAEPKDAESFELTDNDPDAAAEAGALPSDVAENAKESEAEEADERLTVGEARTADSLTAGERAFLAENGYVIAAILPEVKASEGDWYDLNAELVEEAPEGGELAWFAFPRDAEASDEDEALFYGEDGAEINAVPETRKVEVSAWFNEGVTYAPVIAVKVDSAAGAKDSLDNADAGDVVTEDALKEAKE